MGYVYILEWSVPYPLTQLPWRSYGFYLVCKSWRETTSQHEVLWTRIPVDKTREYTPLEGFFTTLQLSKGAKLTLSVHLSANSRTVERTNGLAKAVLDQHFRVRSLHLTADPRSIFEKNAQHSDSTADCNTTTDNPPIPNRSQHFSSLPKGLRTLLLSLPSPTVAINISSLIRIYSSSISFAQKLAVQVSGSPLRPL